MNAPSMKTKDKLAILAVLMAALFFSLAPPVRADDLSISLTTNITGPIGSTITVFGDLTNNTSQTLSFAADSINLAPPATVATAIDDLIFNGFPFGSEPSSIAPGSTLQNVDLFTISLLGGSGTYAGNSFVLLGGTDSCSNGTIPDCLGSVDDFSFNVGTPVATPEPATLLLLGTGLVSLGLFRKRTKLSR